MREQFISNPALTTYKKHFRLPRPSFEGLAKEVRGVIQTFAGMTILKNIE